MANEQILIRMGLDQQELIKGLAKSDSVVTAWSKKTAAKINAAFDDMRRGSMPQAWDKYSTSLNSLSAESQNFLRQSGQVAGNFAAADASIAKSIKGAFASLRQLTHINLISIAKDVVTKYWDAATRQAAELLNNFEAIAIRTRKAKEFQSYWRAERAALLRGQKEELEMNARNADREETRLDLLREAKRLEEEMLIKEGDSVALAKMRIRHLQEDIKLIREKMQFNKSLSSEDASKKNLENARAELAIVKATMEIEKLKKLIPPTMPFLPVAPVLTPLKQSIKERQEALRAQMASQFGDPTKTGYRDPLKAKAEAAATAVNEKLDKLITPEGLKVVPPD